MNDLQKQQGFIQNRVILCFKIVFSFLLNKKSSSYAQKIVHM